MRLTDPFREEVVHAVLRLDCNILKNRRDQKGGGKVVDKEK